MCCLVVCPSLYGDCSCVLLVGFVVLCVAVCKLLRVVDWLLLLALLFVVWCCLSLVGCSVFAGVVCCLSCVDCCVLLVARCVVLVVCCALFVISWLMSFAV